jgi:MFS transporter, OPA family, glycerol-3-phosphate transporter
MAATTTKLDGRPINAPVLASNPGDNAVIWTLWLTYGAFYFCRTNISAAVPGLKASIGDGGLGLSATEVGWILASLKIAYGLGQFFNGQMAERFSPRVMLALGMFGSAALNVLFGLGTGFYFLLFVWATNGFFQSLGWTPCVRVAANWVPVLRRGHAIGLIGTGYQITLGLTFVVASWAAARFGWQGALYVPAILLALTGLFMLVCLREAPTEHNVAHAEELSQRSAAAARMPFAESLYWTLYNPTLWLLGLSLGLLNACRYGYIDWGLTHLIERRPDLPLDKAGLQYFVIAIGATAGAYLAGWATDRFFGSRRGPVICVLMAALGVLSLTYDAIVRSSPSGTMLVLVVIGFCIYGPQVLLVGTAPADLAHRGASAAAAGFVNFMGYMGAATGDVVTGYYSSPEHGGWRVVFYILAGWAFAGSVVTGILWNTTARRIGVLPGIAPKLGGIAALVIASVALEWGEQPQVLRIATYLAAACLLGTFQTRWAAAPALAVAAIGLALVFASYVRMSDGVTWDQALGMVAYGLTAITSLMVLVEKKGESCASS